ncbi:hypothetical protein [Thermoflavimicrobium daqui]|uniref:Uncharacterized protein n=1 Tax=Thermoflavimicrobium daqui TaxID=2137476 RepID=A0A364K0E6_9BACL|nr:hypothetical protein [Thermoflavimicrobium daqui]RAL20812.1 hypothetical protein DL897_17775 [Thermoflavimicrobium daqui]
MKADFIHINGISINTKMIDSALVNQADIDFFNYVNQVAKWFAYTLSTQSKYMVSHKHDPPWDYSGQLINTNQSFDLNDYPQLQDFIEEYNGHTLATFLSGCGFHHVTYSEELEELTFTWISGLLEDLIIEMFSSLPYEQLDQIITTINDEQIFYDLLYTLSFELIEKVSPMNSKILFELGKELAYKQMAQEKEELQKRKKREQETDLVAQRILQKLQAQYKLAYRETMPNRIERPLFMEKVKPLLFQLHQLGIPLEEIRLLSKCGVWSNSVVHDLENLSI